MYRERHGVKISLNNFRPSSTRSRMLRRSKEGVPDDKRKTPAEEINCIDAALLGLGIRVSCDSICSSDMKDR